MRSKILRLLIIFLCFATVSVPQRKNLGDAKRPSLPETSPSIDDALWWLPPDTETIIAARESFQFDTFKPSGPPELILSKILQVVAIGNFGDAGSSDDDEDGFRVPAPLAGIRVLFAVEGARNFRAPAFLGGMPYDGCNVVVLEENRARSDAVMKFLVKDLRESKTILGHQVYVHKRMRERDLWETFYARPQPNVFLIATNEAYLTEVLNRIARRGKSRALPEGLPEWRFVDRTAPFWAVRHFDRKGAKTDPSSPFGGTKPANKHDEQAIGWAFSHRAESGPTARIFYLSENPHAEDIAKDFWTWESEGQVAKVRRAAPGAVEVTVQLKEKESVLTFFLGWLGAFGRAVYL